MSLQQDPSERLNALLQKLTKLPVTRQPAFTPLSLPQTAMLDWVARSPGIGVQEIAKGIGVTPPTVSVAIRRLVRDGWLARRQDPDDRRARPLYLTEKGEEIVAQFNQHRTQMLQFFLSGLAPEEQEQLIDLLARAINRMEAWMEKQNSEA
jgi:MarR family transcriptional regulator for hemolysin